MSYALWMTKPDNDCLQKLLRIFKYHSECQSKLKQMSGNTKKAKVKDGSFGGALVHFKSPNIWNLSTLERFIRVIHE